MNLHICIFCSHLQDKESGYCIRCLSVQGFFKYIISFQLEMVFSVMFKTNLVTDKQQKDGQ